MRDQRFMVRTRNGKHARKCCAPAAGCFGQLYATESYGSAARRRRIEELSEWERFAERFAIIDYGDGQMPTTKH